MLTAGERHEVAAAARAGVARAKHALRGGGGPLLAGLAERIDPSLGELTEAIGACLEADGSDFATPPRQRSRRLRRDMRAIGQRVADELRRLARSSQVGPYLQEDFVTQRGGRAVLAVKASARHAVPGVVHDASGSGETLFVEPFAVIELANRRSEAAGAEREGWNGSWPR